MKWFRFYTDALNNPKVQSLPSDLFKFWVNILCVTSQCNGALPSHNEIAFYLRMPAQEIEEKLKQLIKRELIDKGEKLKPHNWEKRQYKSDVSAERTRKYRERKRAEGDEKCDVTGDESATPPEYTDTEYTDTEYINKKSYKKKKGKLPDDFCVTDDHRRYATEKILPPPENELEKFRDYHLANDSRFADWDAAFRNWLRKAKEFKQEKKTYETTQRTKRPESKTEMLNRLCAPGAFAGTIYEKK